MFITIFYKVQKCKCLGSCQRHLKTVGKGPRHIVQWLLMSKSLIIVIRRTNGDDVYLRARLPQLGVCFIFNTGND